MLAMLVARTWAVKEEGKRHVWAFMYEPISSLFLWQSGARVTQ